MQVKSNIPTITVPVVDLTTGVASSQFYRFFETLFNRTGGVNGDRTGTVEVRVTAVEDDLDTKADKTLTITAGNGLSGTHDLSASFTMDAKKNTGWTAATGTANKGAYAAYVSPTISVLYTQAEVQALSDALQAATRRIVALEAALRLNGGIDG